MKMRGEDLLVDRSAEKKAKADLQKLKLEIQKIKAEREDQDQVSVRTGIKAGCIAICTVILSLLTCEMNKAWTTNSAAVTKHRLTEENAAKKIEAEAVLKEKQAILAAANAKLNAVEPIGKDEVEQMLYKAIKDAVESRETQIAKAEAANEAQEK